MGMFSVGLVLFFIPHSFTMWRSARGRLVERLGVLPYRGLYSLVALGGFVLMVLGYGDAPRIEVWAPPYWLRHVAMLLMVPALVLLVAAYVPGHIKARVRNPMLLAVKTWAFAHLLANGDLASMILFGAFLTWSVIDLIAVKRGGRGAVVAQPRMAFDVVALVGGLGLYAGLLGGLHQYVAGVALLAP